MNAAQFREMFHALHNIDLSDLEGAGVIKADANGGSDWTRFNSNLTTFVLKLPADRLERLCALVEARLETLHLYAAAPAARANQEPSS